MQTLEQYIPIVSRASTLESCGVINDCWQPSGSPRWHFIFVMLETKEINKQHFRPC